MATIHSQHYHHSTTTTTTATSTRRLRRQSLDYSSLPSSSSSSNTLSTLKHSSAIFHSSRKLTCNALSTTTTPAPAPTPTPTTSTTAFSLEALERHLSNGDFRQADEETRRMLIVLAGEAAIKRGYVFFSEVQFISKEDLKAIDELWKKYSNDRFGYSVQKKLWVKSNKDFTSFFKKVGWMKKLDTEIEQYNYRSFPTEFMWELNLNNTEDNNNKNTEIPPEGHLPLTNALRGTQLLSMIFTHPAFDEGDDEENRNENDKFEEGNQDVVEDIKKKSGFASLRDRLFKRNYSF